MFVEITDNDGRPVPVGGIQEISIQGGTLPGAGNNLPGVTLVPVRQHPTVRLQFTPSNSGILSALYTVGATTSTQKLISGASLSAGVMIPTEFRVPSGTTAVNFQYTGAVSGTFDLLVWEA